MGWQTAASSIVERAQYLYHTGEFSDVLFLVGPSHNMKAFPAHRIFLAMSSEVFAKMLANKQWTKLIPDMHPDVFQTMLKYIYTDDCEFHSTQHAIQVLRAAQIYQISGLSKKCLSYMAFCRVPF